MWSDKETQQDCLGFTAYTAVLADICLQSTLAPLTVGVFGSWGSGKSSLMHMLRNEIDGRNLPGTETIWFNAWRYEGKEEAQSALVHSIIKRLQSKRTLGQEALQYVEKLKDGASVLKLSKFIVKTVTTMTPDLGGLLDCFKEESQKVADTMENFDKDFSKLMELEKVDRIVIFIDDLDRCSSAKVIDTFETIKLFLNTPSCTFVIGADPLKIEKAVGDVYSFSDSPSRKDYLEKIIQLPFSIPQQSLDDIACYVGMLLLSQGIDETAWTTLSSARSSFYSAGDARLAELQKWHSNNRAFYGDSAAEIGDQLTATVPFISIVAQGLRGNPRQIKRFLNILALRRKLALANAISVDNALLIKIGVLEYVWPDFFQSIADTVDPTSGQSDLLAEMYTAEESPPTAALDSALVADALKQSGLMSFLREEPKLDGSTDLRAYVFLAQTSLSRQPLKDLVPLDEKVQAYVSGIENEDRVRSMSNAKRAAADEASVAEAVVRHCCDRYASLKDTKVKTHVLAALQTICRTQSANYATVLKLLAQLTTPSQPEALVAAMVIDEAQKAGGNVAQELVQRMQKGSKFSTVSKGKSGN